MQIISMDYNIACQALQIDPPICKDKLNKQYRKLAFEFHPDKNSNDPIFVKKFQLLLNAYEFLSSNYHPGVESYSVIVASYIQIAEGFHIRHGTRSCGQTNRLAHYIMHNWRGEEYNIKYSLNSQMRRLV